MYILRKPAAQLRDFIEHYWFVLDAAGESVDLRVEVFVDARADLIFNFGAPYRREVIGGAASEIAASNFDAQRLVPIRIGQHGRVRVSGVRFHLGGVGPFTSTSLAESSGSTPPPEVLFGPDAERLEAELRYERDPDAAAALLDAFFLERLSRCGANPAFLRALDALRASDGQAGSAELADAAEVSRRQLERLFARELGFPPKTVGRVLRFQRALLSLMTTPDEPLGSLAAATGYFDQAHFIRDFKQFTGGIPRGYRGYYPPTAPTDFAPNVVVFVQDASGSPDPD
jgi:AraC-like DNA-binding protein